MNTYKQITTLKLPYIDYVNLVYERAKIDKNYKKDVLEKLGITKFLKK